MATFTYTTTSSDLKTGRVDNTWGYGNFAYQGNIAVAEESDNFSHCFGIIVFSGAGDTLRGKSINSITMEIKYNAAGISYGAPYKTLKIHESNYQDIDTSRYAVWYLDTDKLLGTLDTIGYDSTETFTLDSNNNTILFNNLKNYLSNGNSAIIIYNDDDTSSDFYSRHFLQIAEITITVTYDSDDGVIYIDNGTTFEAYQIYIDNGTGWDLYIPYIDNGSSWDSYG